MKLVTRWLTSAAVIAAFAPGVLAQGPPGGGGMPNIPPAVQKQFQKMRAFGENHKNYRALGQTMRAMGEMDKDPKTKITPAQAKKILAVINTWKTKPSLTDDQALQANKQLTATLSLPQIKKMATTAERGGGRMGGGGGGFGGGGGRPGGGGGGFGGGGGGRMGGGPGGGPIDWSKMKIADPKEYNPFNPATMPDSPMKQRAVDRMKQTIASLQARAKG